MHGFELLPAEFQRARGQIAEAEELVRGRVGPTVELERRAVSEDGVGRQSAGDEERIDQHARSRGSRRNGGVQSLADTHQMPAMDVVNQQRFHRAFAGCALGGVPLGELRDGEDRVSRHEVPNTDASSLDEHNRYP